jgi:hypothetical protein
MFVYIIFNIFAATAIYWLARMPKGKKFQGKNKKEDLALVKTRSSAATTPGQKHIVDETDVEKSLAAGVLGGKSTPGDSSSISEHGHDEKRQTEKALEADTSRPREKETRYEPIISSRSSDRAEEDSGASTPVTKTEHGHGTAVVGSGADRPAPERFTTAPEF